MKILKTIQEEYQILKPFIDQYKWEGIDFPAGIKDWKKFEKNDKTIALNILFVPHNEKKKSYIQIKI